MLWPSLGRVIPSASMEASKPTKQPSIRDLREIYIHEIYMSVPISDSDDPSRTTKHIYQHNIQHPLT